MALEAILAPQLVEVGKVKAGRLGPPRPSKSGGAFRPPEKLDHFLVTTLHRDDGGQLVEDAALMASLAEHADADRKLRRLPITVLSNVVSEVMTARYAAYNGKRAEAVSDGETLTEYADRPGGAWLPQPRTLPHTPETTARWPALKLAATLNVMINSPAARLGGVYKFRTTSRITGEQLFGSLTELQRLTGGVLRGLPLRLVIRPLSVAPQGKPTVVYVVHVEFSGDDLRKLPEMAVAQLRGEVARVREIRALESQYKALLAHEPEDLDPEEVPPPADEPAAPPPPAEPSPVQVCWDRLTAATTLAELAAVWEGVPPALQKDLAALKDERKAKLTPPASPPPPLPPPPAEPVADAEFREVPAAEAGPTAAEVEEMAKKAGYGNNTNGPISWVNLQFRRSYVHATYADLTPQERQYLVDQLGPMAKE